jgi:hypothetical protein
MKTLSWMAVAALAALLVAGPARAGDEVPNINKRGTDEKKFAAKLAESIVKAARTSVKEVTLEKSAIKEPKKGRTEWHLTAGFKGRATKKDYEANIIVYIDTLDKDKWEVYKIDYKDNSKNVIGYSKKNVTAMVNKLNGK